MLDSMHIWYLHGFRFDSESESARFVQNACFALLSFGGSQQSNPRDTGTRSLDGIPENLDG